MRQIGKGLQYVFLCVCVLVCAFILPAHAEPAADVFELPLQGATGYASIPLSLQTAPTHKSKRVRTLTPGQAFTILQQEGKWFKVRYASHEGYVPHVYCMVNLPDIIPSIIYNNSNVSGSILRSSGKDLPQITGKSLYNAKGFNARFGQEMYVMPALYTMAKKIQMAQNAALAQGNTLVLYEAFRSHDIQRKIVRGLAQLMEKDAAVRRGVSTPPWGKSWFVSQGTSNHQRGYAIDVHLAKIDREETKTVGKYAIKHITAYTEYVMPSPMHELSNASVVFAVPVTSRSTTAWKKVKPAKNITEGALLLQKYCTDAGLTPLASEWWHFNDLGSGQAVGKRKSDGKFSLEPVVSVVPQ